MKWLRPTVTHRFLLILFGFLALQLLQLGVGIYSMMRIGQLNALVSTISEQRLQTLMLGDLARNMFDRSDVDQTQQKLGFGMIQYGQGLLEIEESMATYYRDSIMPMALVGEARLAWSEDLYPLLQRAYASQPDSRQSLLRYEALVPVQVGRLDRIISLLEETERTATRQLLVFQTAVVGLSLLLLLAGMWIVRFVIVRPLKRLIAATRAIAAGAYDRRVDIDSYDEFGELARMFNRMAAGVGNKTERLHALNEVALVVTSSLSLDEILDQIMVYGMPLSGACGICIAFYDESNGSFHYQATRGLSKQFVEDLAIPTAGLANDVMCRGDYAISNDVPGAAYPLSVPARREGIRSVICLPLASDSQRLGVIYFYRNDRDDFEFEEIELIRTFSRLAAHAIQNAQVHATAVDMAEHDALTGLHNRRKLEQRLREEFLRAQRLRHALALVVLDVDRFKSINDSHGHAAGDAVLKALAQIFRREVRDIDLAARSGGEEFVFVLPGTDGTEAYRAAERIRSAVAAQPIMLHTGTVLTVTVSLGIASYPQSADSVDTLIANADRALYAAKRDGRDRSVLYDDAKHNPVIVLELPKKKPDRNR